MTKVNIDTQHEAYGKIFMETSLHYNYIFGSSRQRAELSKTISKNTFLYTSVYVLKEFHNVFSIPLIHFCYYIRATDSISDAIKEFKRTYAFKNRRQGILLDYSGTIIDKTLNQIKNFSNKERAIAFVKDDILAAEKTIFSYVNTWIDTVQLDLPLYMASSYKNLREFMEYFENRDQTFPYNHFLKIKKTSIQKLFEFDETTIKGSRNEIKKEFRLKLKPLYKQIIEGSEISNGKIIKMMGDTIIALECPTTCTLLSYDQIFALLSMATEKSYKIIPQPESLSKSKGFWKDSGEI